MSNTTMSNRIVDARPDRIDYRDRLYLPKLVSLPHRFPDLDFIDTHFKDYKALVLDQGDEGACVGFGLAALINYLQFKKSIESDAPGAITPVSPRMLHAMARFYDEWPGEDYLGTSCRGAMKGWYRHGVCSAAMWPYRRSPRHKAAFIRPEPRWQEDALTRPLGAYYRVNKESITDMQSALCEVGALYVSARYHRGWDGVPSNQRDEPPVIRLARSTEGAHAFALVGYEQRGFILQNSWGLSWGFNGFAIITYDDWLKNAEDAWVAVLGAPVAIEATDPSINVRARRRLGLAAVAVRPHGPRKKTRQRSFETLAPADAYQHTVVLGNNGSPSNRFLDIETAAQAVEEIVHRLPLEWLTANKSRKVLVFAQDTLTTEEAAIDRVRVIAPRLTDNGIYPIFLTARPAFRHTLARLVDSAVTDYLTPAARLAQLGLDPARTAITLGLNPDEPHALFASAPQSRDSRDQSVEVACQDLTVKPIWMQMKRTAEAAQNESGALTRVARNLQKLKNAVRNLEIHLASHSAGAYSLGHLLEAIAPLRLHVASCTFLAPACTVDFACEHFLPAMKKGGVMHSRDCYFEILSDKREREDSVGPYSKSLLYLISRGMEDVHGIPILGMERVWSEEKWPDWPDDVEPQHLASLKAWRQYCRRRTGAMKSPIVNNAKSFRVIPGKQRAPATHADFDRDVRVLTRLTERIRRHRLRKAL